MGVVLPRMSHYPGGFNHGLTIRGIPLHVCNPGEVFWVDENASSPGRGTFKNPDTSVEGCMARTVAHRGDQIWVKPGHIENVSSAAALTCDIAGVAVIGTGHGSKQAKIEWDTADTADVAVSAANVSFVNMWLNANFAMVEGAFEVADAGDYFTIQGCRITTSGAAYEFENFCTLADDADYFSFLFNDVHQIEATTPDALVLTVGESLEMRVIGNNIVMEATESIFDVNATAITGGPIFKDNLMINLTAAADYCVEIDSSTVAMFVNERYGCAGAAVPVADISASFFINCVGTDAVAIQGMGFPKATAGWP